MKMSTHRCFLKMSRYRRTTFAIITIALTSTLFLSSNTSLSWITSRYYDHRGYLMSRSEEQQFNLQEIAKTLRVPHEINTFNFDKFKKEYLTYIDPGSIVVTKDNIKIGQQVGIYFNKNAKVTVDEKLYNLLPDAVPLKKSYSTCSLVGSSGILGGSGCGKQIDNADFVLRMNLPPLTNYSADVGIKANLTTMNPSIIKKRYYYLHRKKDKDSFMNNMKEFKTYIYIPVFATSNGYALSIKVAEAFTNTKDYPIKPLFMHPSHFLGSTSFWRDNGITATRISSGLYMVSVALTLCDKVNLYGFWPFHKDHNNLTVEYHYYEKPFVPLPKVHKFAEEFSNLLELHNKGVLNMHVGTCDEQPNVVS
ncbi:alpha-N-acetylneuraminide alpha-2,8-sialyltransferase-like [Antedon mediterranea]|uniref:alpha-N-acetylneuraminide alpha-2,8-sialyltransferase-like n=1 Tax=Antedon mediterranea TaxID=105859 RepID=UPI003AF76A5C